MMSCSMPMASHELHDASGHGKPLDAHVLPGACVLHDANAQAKMLEADAHNEMHDADRLHESTLHNATG